MNILHLVLKAQWYNLIASGVKKEEYREIKPYWLVRLFDVPKHYSDQEKEDICRALRTNWLSIENAYIVYNIIPKPFTHTQFKHGYSDKADTQLLDGYRLSIGEPRPEWSGGMTGQHFVIDLGQLVPQST